MARPKPRRARRRSSASRIAVLRDQISDGEPWERPWSAHCDPALAQLVHGRHLIESLETRPRDLRRLWEDLAELLVTEHIARCPGSRPAAWWRWSSPESWKPRPTKGPFADPWRRPRRLRRLKTGDVLEASGELERQILEELGVLIGGES